MPVDLPACLLACHLAFLLVSLPVCIAVFLSACMSTYLLAHVPAYSTACLSACMLACMARYVATIFVCIWYRPASYTPFTQAFVRGPARAGVVSMVRVNASRAMPARLSISTRASVGWFSSSSLCKCVASWKTSRACSFGTTGDRPTSRINSTMSRMCPAHSLYDRCKAIEKNVSSLASVHCKRELTRVVLFQAEVTNAC